MAIPFACRRAGCNGVVGGESHDAQFVCPDCGASYKRKKRTSERKSPAGELEEFGGTEEFDDFSAAPIRTRPKRAETKAGKTKAKSKSGARSAIGGFLHANRSLLLTRVLPAVVVLVTLILAVAGFARRKEAAAKKEELAAELGSKIKSISTRSENNPYIRGRMVVLDVDKPGESTYHVNSYIDLPADSREIGSVIVVNWKLRQDPYRTRGGTHLYMKNSRDPVALNHWNCRISLVDLKRKVVVYQTSLQAPEKYGELGEVVVVTPMTIVPAEDLAKVFDEIKGIRTIGLDDEPPAKPGN